jgi:hypothetical protein
MKITMGKWVLKIVENWLREKTEPAAHITSHYFKLIPKLTNFESLWGVIGAGIRGGWRPLETFVDFRTVPRVIPCHVISSRHVTLCLRLPWLGRRWMDSN